MSIQRYNAKSISGFVPHFVSFYSNSIEKDKLPYQHSLKTGLLFIDVCDYTAITEKVTKLGHYGVETITSILNSYYEVMNNAIQSHGGEIAKYAGDAALAVFIGEKDQCLSAIYLAVASLQEKLEELNRTFKQEYDIEIRFHGSAAWGQCKLMVFGDPDKELNFVLHGHVLNKLYLASTKSARNQVFYANRWRKLPSVSQYIENIETEEIHYAENTFIPDILIDNVDFSHFSGELRNTAILFIAVDYQNPSQAAYLKELDRIYRYLQHTMVSFEGLINKIDYTDKGMVILCSFGIPNTHLDDIERAVICARKIIRYRGEAKFRIGITYSNIYAGFLGSKTRFEYGIIGNGVNIASRLMSEAKTGQILLTEEILSHIEVRFETDFLMQASVKGIKDMVNIYRIVDEIPVNQYSLSKLYQGQKLIAWQKDYDTISETIQERPGSFVFVNGDPGVGKTFFAWQVLQSIKQDKKDVMIVALEEYNQSSHYFMIITILQKLWNVHNPLPEFHRLYDTVDVVAFDLDIELIRNHLRGIQPSYMTDADRKYYTDLINNQLLNLLTALFIRYRFLIVDNLQWLDDSSLKLLIAFMELPYSENIHIIVTSRFGIHRDTFERHLVCAVDLQNLSPAETEKLVKNNLESIAMDATQYLYQVTKGNPLFIVEICRLLKNRLHTDKSLITKANIAHLEREGKLPHSIENLFITRFSGLSRESQYILKIASIIGKAFTLNEIVMVGRSYLKEQIVDFLSELDTIKAITKTSISPEVEYIFTHSLMRDAIYNTILLSEKKGLHNLIAGYYVKRDEPDLDIIANHYILAENTNRALNYCQKAAEKHYKLSHWEESSFYYENALRFCMDESLHSRLKLAIIDNLFFQGNTERAGTLLQELEAKPPKDPESLDKYLWLHAKRLFLASDYDSYISFAELNLPKISDKHYRFMLQMYYAEALRLISAQEKLQKLLSSLQKEVFDAYITNPIKSQVPEAFAFADAPSLMARLHIVLELLHPFKDDPGIHQSLYYLDKIEATAGYADLDRSDYKAATYHFENKLNLALIIDDNLSKRIAYHALGMVQSRLGKKRTAMKLYQKALDIAGSMGDRYGYAKVLSDIGILQRQACDYKGAVQSYQKSLEMAILTGNKIQQEIILYNFGELYYQQNNLEKAEEYYYQALALAEKLSDHVGVSYATDAIGDLYYSKGEIDKAEKLYLANFERQTAIDDAEGLAHTYGNLANVAKARNQFDRANEYYAQNLALCQRVGDLDGEGRSWYNSAALEYDMENYFAAMEKLQKAEHCFIDAGSAVYMDMLHELMDQCRVKMQ